MENSVGDNPISDSALIILGLLFGVGCPWLCCWTGLDTKVNEHGVCIRFRPFHRRWVVFSFEDIRLVEAVTYNPLKDFGGWGIKYGKGVRAYNVGGNKGVSLTLTSGEKILLGSTDHEVLCSRIRANHERIGA